MFAQFFARFFALTSARVINICRRNFALGNVRREIYGRTLNRRTRRPLQDSAIIVSPPGMEEPAFSCENQKVSSKFEQPTFFHGKCLLLYFILVPLSLKSNTFQILPFSFPVSKARLATVCVHFLGAFPFLEVIQRTLALRTENFSKKIGRFSKTQKLLSSTLFTLPCVAQGKGWQLTACTFRA